MPLRVVSETLRSVPAAVIAVTMGCVGPPNVANLGDVSLESGEVIHDCRIAYRTFGRLDPAMSNAVLVAPWFLGTSRDLVTLIGPGKLVDSSRYFVIAVEALGNGVASSPSNTATAAGASFPRISVNDIVETQYRLVTQVLHLTHLKAVVGVSFGGMQAFEWTVSHPRFVDGAVAIAATPRSSELDKQHWAASIEAMRATPRWRRAMGAWSRGESFAGVKQACADVDDYEVQARALMAHDVSRRFGGSLQRAADAIRARLMVVTSARDPIVDPACALTFGALTRATVLQLDGGCGHQAPSCEHRILWPAVGTFLAGALP